MNKVLTAMLKGAAKNPLVFGLVVGFVSEQLAALVAKDGISANERVLIGAVRGIHDVSHEFLTAVGEQPE